MEGDDSFTPLCFSHVKFEVFDLASYLVLSYSARG